MSRQRDEDAHIQTIDVAAPTQLAVESTVGRGRKFSRRQLALGLGGIAVGIGAEQWLQHGGFNADLPKPLVSSVQIGHLLRRAGFGATANEQHRYATLGFAGAVERLLNYQQVDDSAMEQRLNSLNLDLGEPQAQQQWWLLRMAWTQRPLLEKMTLFWHGHFTSSFTKVGGSNAALRMIIQNQFLRDHAFDTFDNLLLGITADPAMLVYLDLTTSQKYAPNENYARELMELFTLGLGHYTQQDVSQGAAALTGWHITDQVATAYYLPETHNTQIKTYLGHTGQLDYQDVVHILANHPAMPWFICRKLFRFFIHEDPSNDDLQPLVDAYVQNHHHMGAVMRTLLLMPQFTASAAYRSRVKSPVEFVVGAYRALAIQGYGAGLPAMTSEMGQTLFNPPDVAGWPADQVSALWLNSGTWMARLNAMDQLLVGGQDSGGDQAVDLQAIIRVQRITSAEQFVDYFAAFLLDGDITQERRTQLVDYFETSSIDAEQVTLASGKRYPLSSVRGTLYLLLASPEYQLN